MPRSPGGRRNTENRRRVDNQKAFTCPHCGRWAFHTRKAARRAAERAHPGTPMSAYICHYTGMWHYGNLPVAVVRGTVGRPDLAPPQPRGDRP